MFSTGSCSGHRPSLTNCATTCGSRPVGRSERSYVRSPTPSATWSWRRPSNTSGCAIGRSRAGAVGWVCGVGAGARWLIRKPRRGGGLFKQQREPRCLPRPGLSWGYSPTRSSSIILLESAACEDNSEEAKTVPASAGQTEDTTQKQPHRSGAEVLQETTIQKLACRPWVPAKATKAKPRPVGTGGRGSGSLLDPRLD
jgi:hypothetical protein